MILGSLKFPFLFSLIILFADLKVAGAQNLDRSSAEALQKTQELLRSPEMRKKYMEKDAKAGQADHKLRQTLGSEELTNRAYNLSAEIMQMLVQKTKGDPQALQELIMKAQTNPKAFYESLTEGQKAIIRDISSQVPQATQSKD